MGRASKLKAARKGQPKKEAVYNWSLEQLADIKNRAVDTAVAEALELMLGIPAMVLSDKFGFTDEQLEEFIDRTQKLYNSVCDGDLTLQDIRDALNEECGARIQNLSKVRTRS